MSQRVKRKLVKENSERLQNELHKSKKQFISDLTTSPLLIEYEDLEENSFDNDNFENIGDKDPLDSEDKHKNDKILSEKLKIIFVEHNVNKVIVENILTALNEYGCKIPTNQESLFSTTETNVECNIKYEAVEDHLEPENTVTINSKTISNWFSLLFTKMTNLEEQMKKIQVKEISVSDQFTCMFKFPIATHDEFDQLEIFLSDPIVAKKMVILFQKYMPENDILQCGLYKIATDDLLFEYNWEGVCHKRSFKEKSALVDVLYESWKEYFKTTVSLEEYIRRYISKAHGRTNKKIQRINRLKEQIK